MSDHALGILTRQAQQRAADPARSVWVNASAGSGKTKVLIERVIRLLLPRENGDPGTPPHRILCLTFTRAAAQEMTERLLQATGSMTLLDDGALRNMLADILAAEPTPEQMGAARRLMGRLLDGLDPVRIMTLHSFCQSVLARFPLEAGLNPGFSLIEGEAVRDAQRAARLDLSHQATQDPVLKQALDLISPFISDQQAQDFWEAILRDRSLWMTLPDQLEQAYRSLLQVQDEAHEHSLKAMISCPDGSFLNDTRDLAQRLVGPKATKVEQNMAATLNSWVMFNPEDRLAAWSDWCDIFFRADGARRSDGTHQGVRKIDMVAVHLYRRLGDHTEHILQQQRRLLLVQQNMALAHVARAMVRAYQAHKALQGQVDFDDLIDRTVTLFRQPDVMPWVMYKLDGGIDHVLVDEAQDTNPKQWEIVAALAREFEINPDRSRTVFVVGDQKQSIYRFQGAQPETFDRLVHPEGGLSVALDQIPMNTSFRSTDAVLKVVDAVFADPARTADLRLSSPPVHGVYRHGVPGRVELWPLFEDDPAKTTRAPWVPGGAKEGAKGVRAMPNMASKIANQIRIWLDEKPIIPFTGQPIRPRDILILVRKRKHFKPLVRALRDAHIPISGMDQEILSESLAIRYLMVGVRWVLAPDDDLSLAVILTSPFIGGSDQDLIRLTEGRGTQSLWDRVRACGPEDWVTYLQSWLDHPGRSYPYQFLSSVLQRPCPAMQDGSGAQALIRRLGQDRAGAVRDLLDIALQIEESGGGLADLVATYDAAQEPVKHALASADDVVRLMTVHGAKGLEAPVVILPDTIRTRHDDHAPMIYRPDQTGLPLPLWVPQKLQGLNDLETVRAQIQAADRAEDSRLLYVALTRAKDWLVVAGAATTRTAMDPQSWYLAVAAGLDQLRDLKGYQTCDDGRVVYATGQETPAQRTVTAGVDLVPCPKLFKTPVRPEEDVGRPKRVEAAAMDQARSPLTNLQNPQRFKRGLLIHKILEMIPAFQAQDQERAVQVFLTDQLGPDGMDQVNEIQVEIMRLIRDPRFGAIFGPEARSEVPIAGTLPDGRWVQGKIDRVLIRPDEILIVDYKTNRPPPTDVADVPSVYREQLRIYRDLIAGVYPGRSIRTALLWTVGPIWMEIEL